MIFQHTIDNVLDGTKTQTRRIVKPQTIPHEGRSGHTDGDWLFDAYCTMPLTVWSANPCELGSGLWGLGYTKAYIKYRVGHTYAVQPGRGKAAVARIRITDIRREDVRNISEQDAAAEGFQDQEDFWFTWITMHDKRFLETYRYASDMGYLREYGFYDRPLERYDAWVLTFELARLRAVCV